MLAILLLTWLCLRRRKHRREAGKTNQSILPSAPAMTSTAYNDHSGVSTMDPKNASSITTPPATSPPLGYGQPASMHPQMMQQPYPGMPYQMPMHPTMQGYAYPQTYSPPFGYVPAQQMMPQDINPHFSQGYGPMGYPSYGGGSPPPPFYNPGPGSESKPVEVDGGLPVQRPVVGGSEGASEPLSQGERRTGDSNPAEMGTESMPRSEVSRYT